MNEIQTFVKIHNLSGGMALLARNMLQQGMNEVRVEYTLLEYGCEEIEQYLRFKALKEIAFMRFLVAEMKTKLPAGDSNPTMFRLEKKARFIEHGLNQVIPPIEQY